MMYVPDNYDLFLQHQAEQDRQLERLPVCVCCDEPIQDECCYEINDELYCEECMKDTFRRQTESFVEGR